MYFKIWLKQGKMIQVSMNTSQKRKINESHSENCHPKKLKTEEISSGSVSPLKIKPILKSLNNTYFPRKCTNKIANDRQTPSVVGFFKKIKILSDEGSSKNKHTQVRTDFVGRNSIINGEQVGISAITKSEYVDKDPSLNEAFKDKKNQNGQNDAILLERISNPKCNLLHNTSKWSNIHHTTSFEKNKSCLNARNFVKDEVNVSHHEFSSQNLRNNNNRSFRAIDEVKKKRNIFSSAHSKKKLLHSMEKRCKERQLVSLNNLKSCENSSNQRNRDDTFEPRSNEKISAFELDQTKIEYSDEQLTTLSTDEINYLHLIQDESKLHKHVDVPKKVFSINSDVSNTNIKPNISFADISKHHVLEQSKVIEESQDFHSMYNTCNYSREHPRRSMNLLISQTMLTKESSFENFVENFIHNDSENANVSTFDASTAFTNSFLQCGDYHAENNFFSKSRILHSESHLPESSAQKEKVFDSNMIINIDKLNIGSCEIQSKTTSQKTTCTTLKKKSIESKGCSKKEHFNNLKKISSQKHLDSYKKNNSILNSFSGERNSIKKIPLKENVKIIANKSCVFPTYGRKETTVSSCPRLERNNDNHYSKKKSFETMSTELSNNLYNHKSEQNKWNSDTKFDKCLRKKNVRNSEATKILYGPQNEKKWDEFLIQRPQRKQKVSSLREISCIQSNDNLIQNSINIGISKLASCESCNQDESTKKALSTIKNSVSIDSNTSNKLCGSCFEKGLKMYISAGSDIPLPEIMKENIENLATYNVGQLSNIPKSVDASSNISRGVIQNKILLNEQNRPTIQNFSEHSVTYCEQVEPNFSRTVSFKTSVGGICKQDTNINCAHLKNAEICTISSMLLETSMDNKVKQSFPHISPVGVHEKLKHFRCTDVSTENQRKKTSNTDNEILDLMNTSKSLSYKEPILVKYVSEDSSTTMNNLEKMLEITVHENGFQESSKNLKKSESSENSQNGVRKISEKICIPELNSNDTQIYSERDWFYEKSYGDLKCDPIPDGKSEKTYKENKIHRTISTAQTTVPLRIKSTDTVISENVVSANTSVNHSFSQYEYDLLKKTSSPLLADFECRNYLKSLTKEGIPITFSNLNYISESNDTVSSKKKFFNTSKCSYAASQEKEFRQFWEHLSSHNEQMNSEDVTQSPNVSRVTNFDESVSEQRLRLTQNSNAENEKIFQDSESEIINHILSQNFIESDSLLNGILKNMNSLSQKSMKKRNLSHNFNQNSNRLLELALKMYKQFTTNEILSNTEKIPYSKSLKNKIEVEQDEDAKIYRLKENSTDEFMILKIKSDSYDFESKNHNFSNTSNHGLDGNILQGLREIYMEKSFLYKKEDDSFYYTLNDKISIITKIEKIFENVLEDFAANKSPELRVRRHTFEDCVFEKERLMLKSDDNPRMIKIHYKNILSQPKFCLMMYVLAKSLELLRNNMKITKREMYYQIKTFVSTQDKINSAIKAVSCMLSVGPWHLNIIAHKGMVFGDLKITLSTNEIINCNVPGTLIPNDVDDFVELKSSAYFILVVEKESIYYKLLEEDLPNRLVKPFIMITGKGFPDLNTQLFLRKLWMVMSLPVFILTDADPHGVNIMITYRFGSLANAHISNQLTVPKAKWLGVFPSEIRKFDAEKQPLTENEKLVIKNILKTPYMTDNPKIENELRIMLELGHKAGIEGIIKNDTFLSEFYFPMKFYNQDLI